MTIGRSAWRAFVQLLDAAGVRWGILGSEEACTGDPAKRAGHDFLFQMLALQNIQTLRTYEVQRIVATCPHCFNTLKNEYPDLGGAFEVWHHSQYLWHLIQTGRLRLPPSLSQEEVETIFHDPCYLGRGNGEYEAPRAVLRQAGVRLVEAPAVGTLPCAAEPAAPKCSKNLNPAAKTSI